MMLPGVIIGPGASIGDHVILNTAATIDHDSVLQDNVIIGHNYLIGAGSVITESIPDNVVAAGVPAKVIRPRDYRCQDKVWLRTGKLEGWIFLV